MVVSKAMGGAIAIGGIALLSFGVVALAHCDQTQTVFNFTMCVRNDWSAAGALGVLLGIVVLILGLVLPFATAPTPPQPAYQPMMYAPVAAYPMAYAPAYPQAYAPAYPQGVAPAPPPTAPGPSANRACTRCGASVTSQFCASCGTQQW